MTAQPPPFEGAQKHIGCDGSEATSICRVRNPFPGRIEARMSKPIKSCQNTVISKNRELAIVSALVVDNDDTLVEHSRTASIWVSHSAFHLIESPVVTDISCPEQKKRVEQLIHENAIPRQSPRLAEGLKSSCRKKMENERSADGATRDRCASHEMSLHGIPRLVIPMETPSKAQALGSHFVVEVIVKDCRSTGLIREQNVNHGKFTFAQAISDRVASRNPFVRDFVRHGGSGRS